MLTFILYLMAILATQFESAYNSTTNFKFSAVDH